MREKLKNYLERISITGTENRYLVILDILEEIGVEYKIQEREYIDFFEVFNKFFLESIGQLSFDFENNSFIEEDISLNIPPEEEYKELSKISKAAGIDIIGKDIFLERQIPKNKKTVSYVKNIIVSLKEYCTSTTEEKIVICAHYDAVIGSTAANDNGSSLSVLLCFIEEIIKNGTDKYFEIVFTDKEETGGIGTKNYIDEYGKDIFEIINIDTCGVGSKIVMCDYSRHVNGYTKPLIDNISSFNVVNLDLLPYCDSDIFIEKGFDIITLCSFPDEDISSISEIKFSKEDKKKSVFNKKKTREIINMYNKIYLKRFYKSEIFKYMHNGKRDSIDWINYEIMEKMLNYLLLIS